MSGTLQSASFQLSLQWIEQITILGKSQNYTHAEMNQLIQQLTSASTPPVASGAVAAQAIGGGGTYKMDLTALSDSLGNIVDGSNGGGSSTPYRVQFFVFWNQGSHAMTISNDVADGNSYPIWGATYSKTLQPGQFDMFVNLAGGTVQAQVTSTTKNILITGTAGDTFGYMVLFG